MYMIRTFGTNVYVAKVGIYTGMFHFIFVSKIQCFSSYDDRVANDILRYVRFELHQFVST